MSARFGSKLRREITTNPKKAGVLALLLLIALWFWSPLVAKWFAKPETILERGPMAATVSSLASATVANSAGSPTSTATPATTKGRLPARPWRQLETLIEQDPRTASATELGSGRDPFGSPPSLASAKTKQPERASEEPDLTPVDAGLVLTSTIVGVGQSVALIGKEVYKEGNVIHATRGEGSFRLIEIRPREIVLEHKGKLYKLSLPTDELAANGDLKPSTDSPRRENASQPHAKLQN